MQSSIGIESTVFVREAINATNLALAISSAVASFMPKEQHDST